MTDQQPLWQCPVETLELNSPSAPALTHFHQVDAVQDRLRPVFRNTEGDGYWMFTDRAVILDGLQHPELWSSSVIVPTEPDPPYKWIPIMIDPPEHSKWRHLLAEYFSPGRVKGLRGEQHRLAGELIEKIAPQGGCDFVPRVARVFPSIVFLKIMGMPVDHLDQFLDWEDKILHQQGVGEQVNAARFEGMQQVMGYFAGLIGQRRMAPNPDADDIVSRAIGWSIDGAPVSDGDLLNCLLLLFMAGLDTVASQLSYAMLHLATHPADRARIVAEPQVIPRAVEELLRVYPIVQTARKATRDMNFHGCPVKAGDMAAFPMAAAGRDETAYPDARRVDFNRGVTHHLSFGAGPHRCLGSHLARQELAVILEEWHRRIPEYEVVEQPVEHGGQVFGLDSLNLRWDS
ncbi:cytochrome P450 [Mycobacterium heckeshornense]|uniref:Cytochrome P450 n=1 Tax=Mycobacterium heckeshornense TaxID=110505 RepID=A0A2G8B4J4_9MYCO|nr:cytochrome P450 [Mycobacterium heckeshornense]KMV24253.1 cytochrome P450 [Mycobacterium heckeshornense]MCV7036494.1 cytochrome P450 [Mycobacterium heckeshornense]PIJ32685.1 cytochrome P450 [Mycobacterium heckeshornense]BCO34357.1 cytochrome P450 [Mycobacterium heckeshornense]BCQ07494.1 cytochrome P450 [Mycobacterium heckeshornense]